MGTRARAVDFIRHQQLAKDRTGNKAERSPSRLALLEDLRAENIRRHQVGSALDALVVKAEDRTQGLDEPSLGQTRDTDQQGVPTAQESDQGLLDHFPLTKNDLADTFTDETQAAAERFDLGNEIGGGGIDGCGGIQAVGSLFKHCNRYEPDPKSRF